jgi:hypothetical protein
MVRLIHLERRGRVGLFPPVAVNKSLILLLLAAGCGTQVAPAGNQAQSAGKSAQEPPSTQAPAPPSSPAELTGLYEGARTAQTDQLCMIGGRDQARFGAVVWGSAMHSCLGAGQAVRQGDRLTFTMSGDSACQIVATVSGDRISFPASVPEGCAYYCGARAGFAGASFTRKGSTEVDALKATDLVGDPLCGGSSP